MNPSAKLETRSVSNPNITECESPHKDFFELVSLYKNEEGIDIDGRFLLTAKAVVIKDEKGNLVGGFFFGKEDPRKKDFQSLFKLGIKEDSIYITGMIRNPESASEISISKIFSNWIMQQKSKNDTQIWGIVDEDKKVLLRFYKMKKFVIKEVEGKSYKLVIFK